MKFKLIAKAKEDSQIGVLGLCRLAKVSRSGFNSWEARPIKEPTLDELFIIDLFRESKQLAGYRTLKMDLERKHGLVVNTKKIRRVKRDYGLVTKRRSPKKFRAIFLSGDESRVAPNAVKRDFDSSDNIFVDITELRMRGGQKAYLYAAKRGGTREIVAFEVSTSPSIEMVVAATEKFLDKLLWPNKITLHSDQGVHFTCGRFRNLLARYGVRQSMSRKGNCLDNAFIESFFGHLKDELRHRDCRDIQELRSRLKTYIEYYNTRRPQWSLKRKTPAEAGVQISLVY